MPNLLGKGRTKFPTLTVEVECIVSDPAKPSYLVGGVRQERGDRSRMTLAEARGLVLTGKVKIVPNSEREEML